MVIVFKLRIDPRLQKIKKSCLNLECSRFNLEIDCLLEMLGYTE